MLGIMTYVPVMPKFQADRVCATNNRANLLVDFALEIIFANERLFHDINNKHSFQILFSCVLTNNLNVLGRQTAGDRICNVDGLRG